MPVYTDTPQRLADALVDLCHETPFNRITVRSIAQRAGLSVRSFYTHFEDKYDLVAWLFKRRNGKCFDEAFLMTRDFRAYSLACCAGFIESADYQRNLVNNTHGRYALRVIVRTQMYELFATYIRAEGGDKTLDAQTDFALRYYLSFCTNVLIDWFMDGMPVAPEELVHLAVDEMMPSRLRPLLIPS